MAEDELSHVKVTYHDDLSEVTFVYAIDENKLHDARAWLAKQENPTARDMYIWLQNAGCQLDSSEGAAIVRRFADGSTEETYYCKGKKQRDNGPAYVRRLASGATQEEYCRDDKPHREDGPALVWCDTNGWTQGIYYRVGEFIKEERLAPLSAIPGVTVQTPAPRAPGRPDTPGPV